MRYIYEKDTGYIKGIIDYDCEVTSNLESVDISKYKIENSKLVEKPKLVGVQDVLRDNVYPGSGIASDGTAEITVKGGDFVSFFVGDIYENLYLEGPTFIRSVGVGETEPGWSTPLGEGSYFLYLHKEGYQPAKVKITALQNYPYPNP